MGDQLTIACIREFNRSYTIVQGLLDRKFMDTVFSVTETRMLYELYSLPHCTAKLLVETLRIDKGYVSRILKKFERNKLIEKAASSQDKRTYEIRLTPVGRNLVADLINNTNERIAELIAPLSSNEKEELCEAMNRIRNLLEKE